MNNSSSTPTPSVNVDLKVVRTFTDAHYNLFKQLHPREAFPHLYDPNRLPKSAKFIRHQLVDIKDIFSTDERGLGKEDHDTSTQTVRQVSNDQSASIRDDIDRNGFSLREEPPAVMRNPNVGSKVIKWRILEGRTRLKYFKVKGVTNAIVDVYEVKDEADRLRIGQIFNNQKKPFGKAKKADMLHTMRQLIGMDAINFGKIKELNVESLRSKNNRSEVAVILREELRVLSSKLTEAQEDGIINNLIEEYSGAVWVRSWPQGNGIQEFIEKPVEDGGLGLPPTSDIKYVAVTGFSPAPVLSTMVTTAKKLSDKGTEIRLLNYVGEPSPDTPEESWRNHTIKFHKEYCEFEQSLANIRFGGGKAPDYKISLYGAVPQIKVLHEEDDSWQKVHKYEMHDWEKKQRDDYNKKVKNERV